jgi:hypothetical protein
VSEETPTGPKLFELGQIYLDEARKTLDNPPEGVDYHDRPDDLAEDSRSNKESAVALAAVASACFAGAQAAAMAMLGAEANSPALAAEWRRVSGDETDDAVTARHEREYEAAQQAAEDQAVGA